MVWRWRLVQSYILRKSYALEFFYYSTDSTCSSIKLPTKRVDPEDSADPLLPGIEIVLGWQTRRITDEIPLTSTTTSLAVAVIWIAVVIGGMAGNWNLWVAVGQLLVASIAFLLVRLR